MAQRRKRRGGLWIQAATAKMARKGTLGKFGRATKSKIASAKARGGLAKKRAVFAENMRRIAQKRKRRGGRRRAARS